MPRCDRASYEAALLPLVPNHDRHASQSPRVRKALKGAAPGTLFLVECTDPMAAIDIPNLMRETGDAIEESRSDGDLLVFHIRKASA